MSSNVFFVFFLLSVGEAHVLIDSAASANHQATPNDTVPTKGSGKKQKNETDKGMSEEKKKKRHSAVH